MIAKKLLALAEQIGLHGIEIEENIKRSYYSEYSNVINKKIDEFLSDSKCLVAETFTHYIPSVVSKRKFYRLAIIVNGVLEYEYFGSNSQQMNDCYLKLKKYCES